MNRGYRVVLTSEAHKDLKKISLDTIRLIDKKIKFFISSDNPLHFAKRLQQPRLGCYRFRIADYRVIFDVEGDVIVILRIGHRKEIYKK